LETKPDKSERQPNTEQTKSTSLLNGSSSFSVSQNTNTKQDDSQFFINHVIKKSSNSLTHSLLNSLNDEGITFVMILFFFNFFIVIVVN
jgi:hypothetical protein